MNDQFSEKKGKEKVNFTDQGTTIIEIQNHPFRDISPLQLTDIIGMNRKFFKMSAELSVNPN